MSDVRMRWGDLFAYDKYKESYKAEVAASKRIEYQHDLKLAQDKCSSENQKPLVILLDSVEFNALSHVGGTGHWYHLMQKILPALNSAYEKIWGPSSTLIPSLRNSNKEIYILFREESSLKHLKPFGRFTLTSILTGGKFDHVHIGYVNEILLSGNQYFLNDVHIGFSVDVKNQPKNELFVKNAMVDSSVTRFSTMCANVVLNVPLIAFRRKFQWISNLKTYDQFRESYSSLCSIKPPLVTLEQPHPSRVRSSNIPDDIEVVMERSKIIDVYTGALSTDPSDMNVFSPSHGIKPAIVSYYPPANEKLKVLVYQRNHDRSIIDVDTVITKLKAGLGQKHNEVTMNSTVVEFEVNIHNHDNTGSPCELIEKINDATVLFTAHGFQNVLLLFQPKSSMLVEIHPYYSFNPHLFGELQLTFRQRFGFPRSFLAQSSTSTRSIMTLISFFISEETCQQYKLCRHISKAQNVVVSDKFIGRFVHFAHQYFVKNNLMKR
eukprot:gene12140-16254_t